MQDWAGRAEFGDGVEFLAPADAPAVENRRTHTRKDRKFTRRPALTLAPALPQRACLLRVHHGVRHAFDQDTPGGEAGVHLPVFGDRERHPAVLPQGVRSDAQAVTDERNVEPSPLFERVGETVGDGGQERRQPRQGGLGAVPDVEVRLDCLPVQRHRPGECGGEVRRYDRVSVDDDHGVVVVHDGGLLQRPRDGLGLSRSSRVVSLQASRAGGPSQSGGPVRAVIGYDDDAVVRRGVANPQDGPHAGFDQELLVVCGNEKQQPWRLVGRRRPLPLAPQRDAGPAHHVRGGGEEQHHREEAEDDAQRGHAGACSRDAG